MRNIEVKKIRDIVASLSIEANLKLRKDISFLLNQYLKKEIPSSLLNMLTRQTCLQILVLNFSVLL